MKPRRTPIFPTDIKLLLLSAPNGTLRRFVLMHRLSGERHASSLSPTWAVGERSDVARIDPWRREPRRVARLRKRH
jgi:hypothetical protein